MIERSPQRRIVMTYTELAIDLTHKLRPDAIDPLLQFHSDLEYQFAHLWVELFPEIDLCAQYRLCEERRFTLDFVHYPSRTGIEIQGGTFVSGMGHSSGEGIERDAEKAQIAAQLGWLVIPVTGKQCQEQTALGRIANTIQLRSEAIADNLHGVAA